MPRVLFAGLCIFCLTLDWGAATVSADPDDVATDTAAAAEQAHDGDYDLDRDHDHAHDDDDDDRGSGLDDADGFTLERLTHWLGKFHPAAVHFPIALLMAAFLAEIIAMLSGSQRYASAGRYCLALGALSAILACALGWFWEGFKWTDGDWVLMTRHRWAGTFTALLSLILLILCPVSARPDAKTSKRLYRVTLLITVALVGLTGFLGGVLVWGADHMAW
ncbi:MAG: DUF2231 domain-containing protein [Phycisphaerales bacterium]